MNQLHSNITDQKKNFFLLILLIFCGYIIDSCHEKNKEIEKNRFKVTIDLIAYKDNSFQLFYKMYPDDSYCEALSYIKKIKGSPSSQQLIFELPHGVKPRNIRFDLGEHENDSIRLENISFQYKNRILKGNHGLYKSWFIFNPNVIPGKDSLTFHLKVINSVFDPQLNGNKILNAKLVKLFPPDIDEKI